MGISSMRNAAYMRGGYQLGRDGQCVLWGALRHDLPADLMESLWKDNDLEGMRRRGGRQVFGYL